MFYSEIYTFGKQTAMLMFRTIQRDLHCKSTLAKLSVSIEEFVDIANKQDAGICEQYRNRCASEIYMD